MGARPVAVITGAATGVGAASARWFASQGYDVAINYRVSAAEANATLTACLAAGGDAIVVAGDVAEDAACRSIADAAFRRWGRIDALVNCAGATLFRSMSDLEALSGEDFARIYAVNVVGPYQMARAVAPYMAERGGAIVNVSSIAGANGTGSSYAYAASKGALNTLTLALARNLAPRIRVNAVLPGLIESRWVRQGIGDGAYERVRDNFAKDAALGVVATPDQVAAAIGWIAMGADIVTGQLLVLDAGLSLGRPPKVEE